MKKFVVFYLSAIVFLSWNAFAADSKFRSLSQMNQELKDESLGWLAPINDCPFEVVSKKSIEIDTNRRTCENHLSKCVRKCRNGNTERCFSAGLTYQSLDRDAGMFGLFQKACQLGADIGCTNLAASLRYQNLGNSACIAKTFKKICSRGGAWGCAMSGVVSKNGEGVASDVVKAREYAERACKLLPNSDACNLANEILDELDQEPEQPDK